jgi:hypothetical protein
MPISLPEDIAKDIRQPVVGDSFNWEATEAAAAKKNIVIHGTGSHAAQEDGFVIANYHVNTKGWSGVGVHFVCTKDGYAGKPNFGLPAGAHMQYVGDLLTWRAGTYTQNMGKIHIEISGLFTNGNNVPSEAQLRAVRKFIDYAIAPNNVLPSIKYYNQVTYHNAVTNQNTACPGWNHPQFNEWFGYLQGGAEPSWWRPAPVVAPAPAPAPVIEPTPVIDVIPPAAPETPVEASDLVPGEGGGIPGYEASYRSAPETRTIQREGAVAVNLEGTVVAQIPNGTPINVAGYFVSNDVTYARTVYSATKGLWNGVDVQYFDEPTGQPSGEVNVTVNPATEIVGANPVVVDEVQSNVTDEQFQQATVPDVHVSIWQRIAEIIASITALIIKKRGAK